MTSIFHEPPPDNGLPLPSITLQLQAPSFLDPPQPPCFNDAKQAEINAITGVAQMRWPHPFVASECVTDADAGAALTIGVWPAGPASPTPDQLDEMLADLRTPIRRQFGETIAFAFTKDFLFHEAQADLGTYSGDHKDANGPTHVQTISVELSPPDIVITKATGYDERPVPDADFTYTITEELALAGGQFNIQPKWSIDIDTTLQDLLNIPLAFFGEPWSDLALAQSLALRFYDPPEHAGAASGLVGNFLGPSLPLSNGQKVQIVYSRAQTTADAVLVGGSLAGIVPRAAAVTIAASGPDSVIEFSQTQTVAQRNFAIAGLQDLLPPLTFTWLVDGEPAGNRPVATAEFTAPAPGTAETQQVTVQVTDRDGLTATAAVPVRLVSPRDKHHGPDGGGGPLNEP